jgi:hypothetical protein
MSGSVANNLCKSCEIIMKITVIPNVSDKLITTIFWVEDRLDFQI